MCGRLTRKTVTFSGCRCGAKSEAGGLKDGDPKFVQADETVRR